MALEPRPDSSIMRSGVLPSLWPPHAMVTSVGGKIRIPNLTDEPLRLTGNEHFCQVLPVMTPDPYIPSADASPEKVPTRAIKVGGGPSYSLPIRVDPDNLLPEEIRQRFRLLHTDFDNVFNLSFPGYNGASGQFEAKVNMGPVQPPQRKGCLPQYSQSRLQQLQDKFDELESLHVFSRPEDVGVVAEYLNPSFLINKPNGGFWLVTAFSEVGHYAKPQPSLMPDVDSTLRSIAQWKYIIVTDLTSAYYQIPLSKDSLRYCGVATPFRGIRVYTRCAMGMPGSESALEELMCHVIGDLLQDGCVAKLADDLFCGGNTPEELLQNWQRVLQAMEVNHISFSASKTIVAPKRTVIMGWVWSLGTIQASPHRIATLSTCSVPETVKGLRSFIGAYKVLSRVIPNCSDYLGPLEEATAGLQSQDKVKWTDDLRQAFHRYQTGLAANKAIVLPRRDDQLWIVTEPEITSPSWRVSSAPNCAGDR